MKKKLISQLIIGFCLGIVAIFVIVGCTTTKYVDKSTGEVYVVDAQAEYAKTIMPSGAKNIVNMGHNWFSFELEGHKYLMVWRYSWGDNRSIGITEISPLTKACGCGKLESSKEVKHAGEAPGLVE